MINSCALGWLSIRGSHSHAVAQLGVGKRIFEVEGSPSVWSVDRGAGILLFEVLWLEQPQSLKAVSPGKLGCYFLDVAEPAATT